MTRKLLTENLLGLTNPHPFLSQGDPSQGRSLPGLTGFSKVLYPREPLSPGQTQSSQSLPFHVYLCVAICLISTCTYMHVCAHTQWDS